MALRLTADKLNCIICHNPNSQGKKPQCPVFESKRLIFQNYYNFIAIFLIHSKAPNRLNHFRQLLTHTIPPGSIPSLPSCHMRMLWEMLPKPHSSHDSSCLCVLPQKTIGLLKHHLPWQHFPVKHIPNTLVGSHSSPLPSVQHQHQAPLHFCFLSALPPVDLGESFHTGEDHIPC